MNYKIIFLSLIYIALISSCKKEDQLIISKPEIPVLWKITSADQPYYEYSINASHLINSEISKYQFTLFNYNGSNQLMSIDYYWDSGILNTKLLVLDTVFNRVELVNPLKVVKSGSMTFEYNITGQLIKTTMIQQSGSSSEYSEFTYNQENRISRQSLFWENKLSGYIDYSYDVKGNLSKEILYYVSANGIAVVGTGTEYEFDDKPNPYRSISRLLIPGVYTNQNNITKETNSIYSGADQKSVNMEVTQNLYEYDASGNPVKKNGTVKFLYK